MSITKYLLIIIFLLFTTINFAQNTPELDCKNGFKTIEAEIEYQETVSYKIVQCLIIIKHIKCFYFTKNVYIT